MTNDSFQNADWQMTSGPRHVKNDGLTVTKLNETKHIMNNELGRFLLYFESEP